MLAGEFVEESLMRRLCDRTKDKVVPSNYEYEHIISQIDALMDRFVQRTHIEGLSPEDLKSLYAMKVHQVLRRDKYDRTKSPRVFFYMVLSNLNRDINRLVGVSKRKNLDEDGFYHSFQVDVQLTEIYEPMAEKHPLDEIMEKLDKTQNEVINITLNNLDKGDDTLIPLAREILSFWS